MAHIALSAGRRVQALAGRLRDIWRSGRSQRNRQRTNAFVQLALAFGHHRQPPTNADVATTRREVRRFGHSTAAHHDAAAGRGPIVVSHHRAVGRCRLSHGQTVVDVPVAIPVRSVRRPPIVDRRDRRSSDASRCRDPAGMERHSLRTPQQRWRAGLHAGLAERDRDGAVQQHDELPWHPGYATDQQHVGGFGIGDRGQIAVASGQGGAGSITAEKRVFPWGAAAHRRSSLCHGGNGRRHQSALPFATGRIDPLDANLGHR